jgi:hypothetical protein
MVTLNYQSPVVSCQFKTSWPDLHVILTQITDHLTKTVSGHSKFVPSVYLYLRGSPCHGRDRMVVGFTTTCAISAYHHLRCEREPRSWQGVFDTTLCDKVYQWLVTGRWVSLGTPVSSTHKIVHHDMAEILLKVALNTNNNNPNPYLYLMINFHPKTSLVINFRGVLNTRLFLIKLSNYWIIS